MGQPGENLSRRSAEGGTPDHEGIIALQQVVSPHTRYTFITSSPR
jgi:hypothetical protein